MVLQTETCSASFEQQQEKKITNKKKILCLTAIIMYSIYTTQYGAQV
jgi:3-deoxy-D-arabino-heptulosonate 7-phosphate (DAHP) synthase class II